MREVKEKSPLKERAAETLKSTPQAAFRRGADAAFQQLRQELREAAQDGKSDDRYESGKITDTATLTLQFSELMYNGTATAANLLSKQSDAALKSLFSVYGYNEETEKYEAINSSYYTVSATDVSGKTLVTIKLAEGKTWPAGYALRVYVSNSVINASRLTVTPANELSQ